MSGTGRGRGRGRGAHKPGEMREPDKNAVEKIHQEKASITTKSENVKSSPSPTPDPADQSVNDSALTTIGEGKLAPAVQDVKDAVRDGLQMKDLHTSSTIAPLYYTKQLDPSVAAFVPLLSSISTRAIPSSKGVSVYFTKLANNNSSNPSSPNMPNSSQLNPESREFVPTNFLPNGDHVFFDNGNMGLDMEKEEVSLGWFSVTDIVRGFEWASPKDSNDSSCEPVLVAGAEILLKVYNYPASFHEIGKNFEETLLACSPSDSALINLAEMLIHWGVQTPEVRYSSCKICHLVTEMVDVKNFMRLLIMRLQEWHKKVFKASTDEEKLVSVNFFGFLSEIYSKIKVGGAPVEHLGGIVFLYVERLLDMGSESFIREACKILKLTGSSLLTLKNYADQINKVSLKMTALTMDESLSETCTHLIFQVVELIGCEWGVAASPMHPGPCSSDGYNMITMRLNTDAAPFIPAAFDEISYNHQVIQSPVAEVEEWYDFVGDDHPIDYTDNPGLAYEDDDEGLDPEIQLEMEAFIDEIEEHLILQDFDPDLLQDP